MRCRCAAYYEWEPSIAKCVSTCKPGYVKQAAILYCSVPCSNPGFPVERDPFTCASTDGTATKSRAWMKRLVGNFSGSTLATAPRATAALRPCARGEGLWTCHASECQATCMLAKGLPAPAQPWAPHPRVDSSLAACRHQPDHCEWRAGLLPVLGAADPGPGPPDQSGPLQQPGVPINLRCLLAPGVNQERSWCQGMLLISQALVLSKGCNFHELPFLLDCHSSLLCIACPPCFCALSLAAHLTTLRLVALVSHALSVFEALPSCYLWLQWFHKPVRYVTNLAISSMARVQWLGSSHNNDSCARHEHGGDMLHSAKLDRTSNK